MFSGDKTARRPDDRASRHGALLRFAQDREPSRAAGQSSSKRWGAADHAARHRGGFREQGDPDACAVTLRQVFTDVG
jgi:hypothetical protein